MCLWLKDVCKWWSSITLCLELGDFPSPAESSCAEMKATGVAVELAGKGGGMRDTISCVSNQHQSPELVKVTAPLTSH